LYQQRVGTLAVEGSPREGNHYFLMQRQVGGPANDLSRHLLAHIHPGNPQAVGLGVRGHLYYFSQYQAWGRFGTMPYASNSINFEAEVG